MTDPTPSGPEERVNVLVEVVNDKTFEILDSSSAAAEEGARRFMLGLGMEEDNDRLTVHGITNRIRITSKRVWVWIDEHDETLTRNERLMMGLRDLMEAVGADRHEARVMVYVRPYMEDNCDTPEDMRAMQELAKLARPCWVGRTNRWFMGTPWLCWCGDETIPHFHPLSHPKGA